MVYTTENHWAYELCPSSGILAVQYNSLKRYSELNEYKVNGQFRALHLILPATLGPGVYSASNRNEYQKH
jgi:hypothetical protein